MNNFILKVGYTLDRPEVNELIERTINELCLSDSRNFTQEIIKRSEFQIPCGTDCLDVSCNEFINCNLITYKFKSYSEEIPQELINLHAILTMFEPVVGVTLSKENDFEGRIWWNRFEEDTDIDEYTGVLN